MSPEQAAAERHIDGRSDQYSLACVVFEMLAGEPPFTGATAQAIMAKRLAGPAPSINMLRPSLPPQVAGALARALAQAPADRYPDTGAFAAALQAAPAGNGTAPRGSRSPPLDHLRRCRAGPPARATCAAITVASTRRPSRQRAIRAAIELVQRADRAYAQRTQAGIVDCGADSTRRPIARDSGYAPAWNGLAQAYVRAYIWAFSIPGTPRDSLLDRALRATDGAFVADSGLASDLGARGRSSCGSCHPPRAPTRSGRCIARSQLDPLDAEAWNEYAFSLGRVRQPRRGLEALAARRRTSGRPTCEAVAVPVAALTCGPAATTVPPSWADSAIALNPTIHHRPSRCRLGRACPGRCARAPNGSSPPRHASAAAAGACQFARGARDGARRGG